jgi:hypothetical protein
MMKVLLFHTRYLTSANLGRKYRNMFGAVAKVEESGRQIFRMFISNCVLGSPSPFALTKID